MKSLGTFLQTSYPFQESKGRRFLLFHSFDVSFVDVNQWKDCTVVLNFGFQPWSNILQILCYHYKPVRFSINNKIQKKHLTHLTFIKNNLWISCKTPHLPDAERLVGKRSQLTLPTIALLNNGKPSNPRSYGCDTQTTRPSPGQASSSQNLEVLQICWIIVSESLNTNWRQETQPNISIFVFPNTKQSIFCWTPKTLSKRLSFSNPSSPSSQLPVSTSLPQTLPNRCSPTVHPCSLGPKSQRVISWFSMVKHISEACKTSWLAYHTLSISRSFTFIQPWHLGSK